MSFRKFYSTCWTFELKQAFRRVIQSCNIVLIMSQDTAMQSAVTRLCRCSSSRIVSDYSKFLRRTHTKYPRSKTL